MPALFAEASGTTDGGAMGAIEATSAGVGAAVGPGAPALASVGIEVGAAADAAGAVAGGGASAGDAGAGGGAAFRNAAKEAVIGDPGPEAEPLGAGPAAALPAGPPATVPTGVGAVLDASCPGEDASEVSSGTTGATTATSGAGTASVALPASEAPDLLSRLPPSDDPLSRSAALSDLPADGFACGDCDAAEAGGGDDAALAGVGAELAGDGADLAGGDAAAAPRTSPNDEVAPVGADGGVAGDGSIRLAEILPMAMAGCVPFVTQTTTQTMGQFGRPQPAH
jgi:hypothetical protein